MRALAIITTLASAGAIAEIPTFDMQTGMLEVPVVEVKDQGVSTHFEVKFKATPDLSSFTLVYGEPVSADANDIQLNGVSGTYSGHITSYIPGTKLNHDDGVRADCSGFPFIDNSADLAVLIEGKNINITHHAFASTECRYIGTINGSDIGGTYQCSNFTSGQWGLNTLKLTSSLKDSIVANISLTGDSCDYDMSFIGFDQ